MEDVKETPKDGASAGVVLKRIVMHEDIVVKHVDRFHGKTIIGCRIKCNFPIHPDGWKPAPMFSMQKMDDYYSREFLAVFGGAIVTGNIITGTDA